MILERATIAVKPGSEQQFEAAMQEAKDHTRGFRESELFDRWRELIGPHFASPPEVDHYGAALATR